jgi:hypothetical protein
MNIDRRAFIVHAGSAVAGLAAFASEEKGPDPDPGKGLPPGPPKPLAEALARGRAENKPVILLRIPEDKQLRHNPGHWIIYYLRADDPGIRELFSETVLVCVESATIRQHVQDAAATHDLVLLDAVGKPVDGAAADFKERWQELPGEIRKLAHGADGARLRERAAAIRQKTDASVLAALDRLGTGEGKPDEDKALLLKQASEIMPLIVHSRNDSLLPARRLALRDVIDAYYRGSSETAAGPRLPFGVDTAPYVPSCGVDHCKEQPADTPERRVACGMAVMREDARMFLRYLLR